MRKLIIIGASGHGKVVADIAKKNGYNEIVFLDDINTTGSCCGYPIVGKTDCINTFDCDFFVGIGNADIREQFMIKLEQLSKNIVILIHPNAVVADDADIGKGSVVMAGAVINPCCKIGKGCIVNTCASVDHDNILGDFAHVAVGAHLSGTVMIGNKTWIGAGATISNNINICENCILGAGAVVVENIEESGTYVGVPAKRL